MCFLKGMDAGHPFAPQYADEVTVTRILPEGVGPGVLWWSAPEESGGWWRLCLEDIPGTMPVLAPGAEDTVRAVEAVGRAGRALTPSPLSGARPITELAGRWLTGWAALSMDAPADLDSWAARHLEQLSCTARYGRPPTTEPGPPVGRRCRRAENRCGAAAASP
ncbi:hypothetical protein HYE82_22625 [Streptomyces sp. BR123]|uniref:hypothetical protein n=1 Tax=Streptomyces sp. BR123 TaxID=2749828 RepID=UPI0015C42328|nr:hypothetical protein [Streptomyces sp. BR123]NXY97117.1 hypothetical protein [Streptomyces sp. BR123]